MKKNDRFILDIEDMGENGEGIGRLDGYIWFVKDAVIGDRIEASAMKMKKNFGFARLVRVIEPSACRVEEKCPVARRCGGCQMQAVAYEEQLRFKERKVYNNLKRIGGLSGLLLPEKNWQERVEATEGKREESEDREESDSREGADRREEPGSREESGSRGASDSAKKTVRMEPIIGMEEPWRYRNKAQFPFGRDKDGRIIAGFYAGRTHCIVENEDCLLGVEENREILDIIRNFMNEYKIEPYNEELHRGLVRHVLIRKGFRTGELMVCLILNGTELPKKEILVERLLKIAGMTSISFNINREKTNVILGKEIVNLYGPGYITDYIGNVKYRISPLSFYQVNPVQTERLYGTALEYAGLTGDETVWDLYCGIGTISLFLAQKAKQVYGVEIVPQAIDDARGNAGLNGMENVEFFVGKAEEVLPEQYEKNQVYADVIVVDPPRKGCDEKCLETIVRMGPKRVVYVSCDSATLARDVKYLGEKGYAVERVRCVDMFPQSGHVETVCLLSKLKTEKHIDVEIDMDELDLTATEKKATYEEIKDYVLEHSGLKVSSLYIAQVKQKCGIIEGQNYNKPKSEETKHPKCPIEKEQAILEALKYFGMV